MPTPLSNAIRALSIVAYLWCTPLYAARLNNGEVHVWETQEITLKSGRDYTNPYTDVDCWIELSGPNFNRRVYGFWDGERTFKVRFVATAPGDWKWKVASNHPDDVGLSGGGTLTAIAWTDDELGANANRRGFVRPSTNGHALQYADGTPFFLV